LITIVYAYIHEIHETYAHTTNYILAATFNGQNKDSILFS
jgi:hypothetical protein